MQVHPLFQNILRQQFRQVKTQDDNEPASCADCAWDRSMTDPYATGDRHHTINECEHPGGCPWGKEYV